MLYGKVKIWNQSSGWGFIECEDGYDYFVNIANVRIGQKLKVNVRVKFDSAEGQKGPEAENVTLY